MSEAFTKVTTEIISAYVAKNHLRPDELVALLKDVHGKLSELANGKAEPQVEVKLQPRMPIKKTVTPGHLISLEDGRPYKTLRRHLAMCGMTPDAYRAKWNLPADYPMVAKEYSERRSALAREMGLGQKRVKVKQGEAAAAIAEDLVDVIAEDVIGETTKKSAIEAAPAKKARSAKKAQRKVTPHPKPKDRVRAKKTPTLDEEEVVA